MTRIFTSINIHKPIEEVFNYVTVPGNWPQWHPSSVKVEGATDHSLEVGEKVKEEFLVAGQRGRVVWTVIEHKFPSRWVIEGKVERGGSGTITYNLINNDLGTKFEREFVYQMPNIFLSLIDRLFISKRIEKESASALAKLKDVLESRQVK